MLRSSVETAIFGDIAPGMTGKPLESPLSVAYEVS
jgi:hypothetical protein